MRSLLAISAAVACAGCQFVPGTTEHTENQARAAVRSLLADGPSARFEKVRVATSTGAVCGSVNAKNAYGAYAGATLFVVSTDGRAHISTGSPDMDAYHRFQMARITSGGIAAADGGLRDRIHAACAFVDQWIDQCSRDFSPSLAVDAARCGSFRQQESQR